MQKPHPRTYAAAHFAMELDGSDEVGLFRNIDGGAVRADVMTHSVGGTYDRGKQLGKPKFEDFKLQVGMAMSKPFYGWISAFFRGEAPRKNGAVIAADFYYAERARREFTEAMIREITIPKFDGSDRGPVYMGVTIAPETIELRPGNASRKLAPPKGFDTQKLWTACNFSLSIDGLDQACARTSKIESFTVKQAMSEHAVGGIRYAVKVPGPVEFPNLVFYATADAQPFADRMKKFGVDGRVPSLIASRGDASSARLTGEITTQDNGGNDLFRIEFSGADITSVTPDRLDAGSDEIHQTRVELYVESMSFAYLGAAVI